MKKYGKLKAYKNGQPYMLIDKEITKDYTLTDFHIARCNTIDLLKYEYDRFKTETITE